MEYNTEERVIKVCKNCHGEEPCWCEEHEYIDMWDFVYRAFRTVGK